MDISFAFRKIQKSIAGFSILAVLASLVSFTSIASAEDFDDVPSSHYAADAVDEASDEGWMTGYDNGDFGVDDYLTRGQAAKILVLGALGEDAVDEDYDAGFTDVSSSYSLEDYVNTAELYGFVSGRTDADGDLTGEYDPDAYMNRAEFAKVAVEAFGLANVEAALDEFPDVEEGAWYEESSTWYVSTAWAWSVINGYDNGNFYPAYSVTRGQAAIIVNNAQEPEWRADDEGEDDEPAEESDGDLTVEVSSESPNAMTIPSNATSVELAAWDFTANGGDVTVDSLSVHHYGITTLASAHQVYLYEGSTRLTSGTTIGSTDNEATFTYNIDIDSGETRTISVRMDMGDYTATGEVGLEIASASKVDAGDATVDGDFPSQAAKHTISTTDAGTVTIEKNGSVDNPQVGEDGAIVAKFKISAATEAAGLEELGVYFSGSVNTADAQNFMLYVSGDDAEPIAEVESVDDLDVIRFDIESDAGSDECENSDGYCIAKGGSKSFYITADFNTGRTDDTVEVYVDQSTDVFARGALYGSGMSVTRTAYDGNANSCNAATDADCSYSTLEGGDITISSDGPSAMDIPTNGRDISVLDFSIVSVTDVTFDSFPIQLDTSADTVDGDEGLWNDTDDAANFTDIKVVNTDTDAALFAGVDSNVFRTAIAGTTNAAAADADVDDAAAFHLFTDDFEMEAGEELNLALTMDIRNDSVLDSMTIVAALDLGTTYPQLKDTNNKTLTNASVLVPTSDVTSKTMTVRSPSLALSLASTPTAGDNTYVKGADDVPFVGLVFACGDSSDCRVTDLTLAGSFDDDADAIYETSSTSAVDAADNGVNMTTVVGSVSLVDGNGVEVAAAKGVNSTTYAVTYDSMDWTIEAGATEIVYVTGDLSTNSFLNSDAENISFAIASAANVTVEDEDGNSFSATADGSTTGSVNASETTRVTTSNGGSLTVAVSSGTARENIVVAGSSDVEISSFEFTTTREDFLVSDFSINNRQSAITVAGLGNYDNNVSSLTVEYEDQDGTTVTDTAYLVEGTATFSGQTFWIPADDSATITVYATLNSISSSGSSATAGEFVDLSLAYNNFEAVAQGSGETYKGDKIDASVAADSDLDFGTLTFTSGSEVFELEGAQDVTLTLGSTLTLTVDNGSGDDNTNKLPVGSLLCVDDNNGATCATEDIYIVTSWPSGTGATDTVTVRAVDDAGDDAYDDEDQIMYALPGSGFHTGTNQMVVYESKPTLALSSTSPSGSRSVSASDDAFVFSVTASSQEKIQINPSVDFATCVAGTGATVTSAVNTTTQVDGSGCEVTAVDTATDSVLFANTADLSTYRYVSFWVRWHDDSANIATVQPDALSVSTADANDGTEDQSTLLTTANVTGAATYFIEDTWYLIRDVVMPTGTDASDTFIGIQFTDTDGVLDDGADDWFIDQFRVYNQKIEVDISSDPDLDRTFNNGTGTSGPVVVNLKESGNTIATGYVDIVPVDTGADGAEDATDGSAGAVMFVPTTAQGVIEIAKGTTKTYTLNLNTTNLLADDGGVDDPVTFSIDYGSSSAGTVTAGDFWWTETNANTTATATATAIANLFSITWLGNTSNSSLVSNTVKY